MWPTVSFSCLGKMRTSGAAVVMEEKEKEPVISVCDLSQTFLLHSPTLCGMAHFNWTSKLTQLQSPEFFFFSFLGAVVSPETGATWVQVEVVWPYSSQRWHTLTHTWDVIKPSYRLQTRDRISGKILKSHCLDWSNWKLREERKPPHVKLNQHRGRLVQAAQLASVSWSGSVWIKLDWHPVLPLVYNTYIKLGAHGLMSFNVAPRS